MGQVSEELETMGRLYAIVLDFIVDYSFQVLGVYFDIREKVKLAFDEVGISIPYPQTDVHIIHQAA